MLTRIGLWARERIGPSPFTNVYGLARTALALSTLCTLLCSDTYTLFRPAFGAPDYPFCEDLSQLSLFCMAGKGHLTVARWVSVILLITVATGWRPRFTGVLHWWVAYSLQTTATMLDGGDAVASILALLLLPVTLLDARRWHWDPPRQQGEWARLGAWSALCMIRLQMCIIYLNAGMAKLAVKEWADGTAMWYWMTDPAFGLPPWLEGLFRPILIHPLGVTLLTWGPILLEVALSFALVMHRRWWTTLLILGILFHATIALLMGLGSFSLTMTAGLILYLRPLENPLRMPRAIGLFYQRLRAVGTQLVIAAYRSIGWRGSTGLGFLAGGSVPDEQRTVVKALDRTTLNS